MGWNRKGQFTAEDRNLTPFAKGVEGNPVVLSSTIFRSGAWSYRSQNGKGMHGFAIPAGISDYRFGFWLYLDTAEINEGASNTWAALHYASTGLNGHTSPHFKARVTESTGELIVSRPVDGGLEIVETVGTPAEFTSADAWFPVGIRHKIHATEGFYSIYVSGVQVVNITGDTRPSVDGGASTTYYDAVNYVLGPGTIGPASSAGWVDLYFDDMYLDEAVGIEPDEAPPARRWGALYAATAGANAQFTPSASTNVSNVDDNPHDSDTTRNVALAANLRDTFNFGDTFVLPAQHAIVQVIVQAYAKRLDTGINSQLSLHAYDGSIYDDSDPLDLTASYSQPIFAEFPTQPDGTDWNVTDLHAMQFGYRSEGTF